MQPTSGRRPTVAILGALLVLMAVLLLLPRGVARPLLAEGGPVEGASVVFYLLAALVVSAGAARSPIQTRGPRLAAGAMLVLFALRELDFHDRFTSQGITRLRFYTSPETPPAEKLVVLAAVAAVAALTLYLGRAAWRALRRGGALPVTAAAGVLLLPLAIGFDRLVRFAVYGREIHEDAGLAFGLFVLEETTELAVPLLFLAAALQSLSWRSRRHRPRPADARATAHAPGNSPPPAE